jgi:hypothetical protein
MKNLITLSILLFSYSLLAQISDKHDYIWILGRDIDLTAPGGNGNLYDFNGDTLVVSHLVKDMNISVTNASISDTAGNLLFYTNGCYIADATHEMMENGDQINYPGVIYDNSCIGDSPSGYSKPQGALILPQPDSTDIYYLFHTKTTLMEIPPFDFDLLGTPFLYTKVDMSKNNGLGAVIEKNQTVLGDTLQPSHLTAVKHANGKDWWIVMTRQFSDLYYKMLFTADGVDSIQSQNIGTPELLDSRGGGQSVFSPDGTKYARYDPASQAHLFDFDRSTGELSNFQKLMILDSASVGGIAISPNSRYLYASSDNYLFQFDLEATDIQASKVLIGTYDGFVDPFATNFWKMQLAPDCRIYMNSTNAVRSMHVIQYPDRKGLACDFQQHALALPVSNSFSFPNFPNYRLGVTPYPCDSTIAFQTLVAIDDVLAEKNEVKIFPNPTREVIHLELEKGIDGEVVLFNMVGQQVFQQYIYKNEKHYKWSLAGLETGIYFYSVIADGRLVGSGKVVKVE